MSVIGSNILAGASGQGGGYNLTRSLRFRSSASAYLNRTPASAGNRKTWTFSAWVKRGTLGALNYIFECGSADTATDRFIIRFSADNTMLITRGGASNRVTTQVFRDPSAWYHVVVAVDTTQATADNRIKLYINGSQVTSFSSTANPAQYADTGVNAVTPQNIGRSQVDNNGFYDGYITDVNLIDGQALTPSSFGETSTTTGVWQPKKYSGSYGTNGFYLPFTDNSALTTSSNVGLGKDFSGNGNYWTTNNISITAGSTYDSMTDVPTLTSATASNFATLSPLNPNGSGYTSQGNLLITGANAYKSTNATIAFPSSGVWYWEGVFVQANNNLGFGCLSIGPNALANPLANTNGIAITSNGFWYLDTSTGISGHTGWSNSTVVGMKWDSSTNTFSYTVDGTTYNTVGSVSTSDGRQWAPACWAYATNDSVALNFGQRPFTYSIPSGALALNTFNLPTPSIGATASTQANKYFDAILYTGNNQIPQTVTGLNFQPDFLWIKGRTYADYHTVYDVIRTSGNILFPNGTNAENVQSPPNAVTSFNSNGFSLGTDGGQFVNFGTNTYVAWAWDANGAGVSNTAGSITSTVSANTSAGFSIVTYTGTGANATVGHGLGVAPSMVIVKMRSAGGNDWQVYHSALGQNKILQLNLTTSVDTVTNYWYNGTTSTVFGVNGSYSGINSNGATYVAYCFSEVAGYSKFGSYTGNSSTDGTFVYTGFRPKYVMVKRSSSAGESWYILDSVRNTFNPENNFLAADGSFAEGTTVFFDFVSNGFKIRSADGFVNRSGDTYIFMAFAESPFKYANAR